MESQPQADAGKWEDEELRDPLSESEWRDTFKSTLDEVEHKGDFCVSSAANNLPPLQPKVQVQGLEDRLAFPLLSVQAKQLIEVAEKAPYGKGQQTVLDEEVRKAWQIDASKVTFVGLADWNQCLGNLVRQAVGKLGLSDHEIQCVQANLYKMLIYENGGHFKKHRDTEKEPGMFGTLIIQLPSKFEGGHLVIEHDGETKTIDCSAKSDESFFYTAFYADCEHELLPVTSGYRLCLVYNLVLLPGAGARTPPSAKGLTKQTRLLRKLAQIWDEVCSETHLGYLLEHKYTETNLGFSNLKGRDKEVASLLRDTCDADGNPLFVVSLVLFEKHDTGQPEIEDYRSRGYYGYDSDGDSGDNAERTMGEVHDSKTSEYMWIGPDDKSPECDMPSVTKKCLLLEDEDELDEYLVEDGPQQKSYEGYMGNYGPTLQFWYYKAAIVFWPSSSDLVWDIGSELVLAYLNFLPQRASRQLAKTIVERFEKKAIVPCSGLFDGVIRTSDEQLILRVMKCVNDFPDDSFATTLASALLEMKSDRVVEGAFELLSRNSNFAGTVSFIEALRSYGLVELVERATSDPKLVQDCRDRVQKLVEATGDGPPAHSWRLPNAHFSGSQAEAVISFLRGNKRSETFTGFSDRRHANNWARKYFGLAEFGYSAIAISGGGDLNAYVEVTKHENATSKAVRAYERHVQELERLYNVFGEAVVGPIPGAGASVAKRTGSTSTAGPSKKSKGDKDDPITLE